MSLRKTITQSGRNTEVRSRTPQYTEQRETIVQEKKNGVNNIPEKRKKRNRYMKLLCFIL